MLKGFILGCCLAGGAAFGQGQYYLGAMGGGGFTPDLSVQGTSGKANASLSNGGAFGALFGDDMYNYWGGEVRYLYRVGDLKLSSAGTSAHFEARTNIIHADFLGHLRPRESRIRPFIAFGAGIRIIKGTDIESFDQPLSSIATFSHTLETMPLADVGGGVKVNFGKSWQARVEMRDYLSPAPNKVITPAAGSSISGWLQDIVGLASISYTF